MDSDGFLDMQSQQTNTTGHCRYNVQIVRLFDHKLALNRENASIEREELKRVNDLLLPQIMALQNTQGSPSLPDVPTNMETQDGEHSQSQRHRRTAFLTPSEQSDSGSDLSHLRTKDQRDHTRRKTAEFVYVQDLDKLIQKRVKEVRVPHYEKLRAVTIDASNSPFYRRILGCEFPKNFTTPTLDCYPGLSNPIQHLCYQDKMVIYARNDPILCRIFPSSLKGVASDWFLYSATVDTQLRGFHQVVPLAILLPPGVQAKTTTTSSPSR